jgi:hypothetical protein
MSLSITSVAGQKSVDVFFDEISGSINRSNVRDYNTDDRYGFGLGIYHSFRSEKRINVVFGWEFNRTSQFKKVTSGSRYSHSTDVKYSTNYLSFPLSCRFNIGEKTKLFFETGVFADLAVGGSHSGTSHTIIPQDTGMFITTITEYTQRGGLPSSFGVFGGLGIRFLVRNFELIIRPEYKVGLNEWSLNYEEYYNRYFRISFGIIKNSSR